MRMGAVAAAVSGLLVTLGLAGAGGLLGGGAIPLPSFRHREIPMRAPTPDLSEGGGGSAEGAEASEWASREEASSSVLKAQNLAPSQPGNPLPKRAQSALKPLPSLAPLVQLVRPTVVEVMTMTRTGFWGRLLSFGGGTGGQKGLGSGVIIAPDGTILTNNHVIEDAARILVRLEDGSEREADLLGSDPETDVALIRLRALDETLTFAELGDSAALRVGDFVLAIGNPFGLPLTVTYGILSGTSRELGDSPFDSYLQTDAAINPGNSGGPLFDLEGRVVGINTAVVSQADGIGFAVPSNLIRTLLPGLVAHGEVRRGFLGASLRDLLDEEKLALASQTSGGAKVRSIHRSGPAAEAGLLPGDVVVAVEGRSVAGASELIREIATFGPGETVRLRVLREGAQRELSVTLGERPQ